MIKKIFRHLDSIFDSYIEKQANKDEEKKYLKFLKKYCIENNFEKETYRNNSDLIKEIFKKINIKSQANDYKKSFEKSISIGQIQNRLYELNKEFFSALDLKSFNSANALARQLIELYLIIYQINLDEDYANVLTGNSKKHKGFPPFKQIKEKLNNKKVDDDYFYYSGIFHPKEDSFMKNLFLIPPNFCGNAILPFDTELNSENLTKIKKYNCTLSKPYYGNRHLMKKGWKLGTFVKNSAGPNRKKILDDFLDYSRLILDEISK